MSSGQSDIESLAVAASAGDSEAFSALVRRMTPSVHAFLQSRLSANSDVESIVQNVWLKVARGVVMFDASRGGKFTSWLFAITRNELIDELRRSGRRPQPLSGESGILKKLAAPSPIDIGNLAGCLERLDQQQRDIIHLRHWMGLSLAEIADQKQMSYSSLKAKAHRAEEQLLACLRRR